MTALACQLFAIPAAERTAYNTLRESLFADMLRMEPLADGWRFHLPAARLVDVGRWVAWERLCCPFLHFEIALSPPCEALTATMRGEGPVREFLAAELGIDLPEAAQGEPND